MIAVRLDKCVQEEKQARASKKNKKREQRSSDLPVLEKEYEKMKCRYRRLISAATKFHKSYIDCTKHRLEVRTLLSA
jgi:hypothetical protein